MFWLIFFANAVVGVVDGYFFAPNSLSMFYGTYLTIYKSYIHHFCGMGAHEIGWNTIDVPEIIHGGDLEGRRYPDGLVS